MLLFSAYIFLTKLYITYVFIHMYYIFLYYISFRFTWTLILKLYHEAGVVVLAERGVLVGANFISNWFIREYFHYSTS